MDNWLKRMIKKTAVGRFIWHKHRFWRYEYRTEKESIRFVKSLSLQAATVLDIGANKGIYSYWLSRCVGSQGHIVAFEAQPELLDELTEVKEMFKLHNLDIRMTALSNQCGKTLLNRAEPGDGSAAIICSSNQNLEGEVIEIDMATLDSIAATLPRPIRFIKCDVEGHELEVFKGAAKVLREDKPTILVEIHHNSVQEVTLLLNSFGFEGTFFNGLDRCPIADFKKHSYRKSEEHRNYIFELIE